MLLLMMMTTTEESNNLACSQDNGARCREMRGFLPHSATLKKQQVQQRRSLSFVFMC